MMDNREYKKVVNSSSEFFKNYCRSSYNDDWKLCLNWSSKWDIKDGRYWKRWMERLKTYILGLGIGVSVFDSVYTTEFGGNGNLHLHSLIYVDNNINDVKSNVWKWCSNKGSVEIKLYDEDLGFDYYMSKYLYVRNENNWGILGLEI